MIRQKIKPTKAKIALLTLGLSLLFSLSVYIPQVGAAAATTCKDGTAINAQAIAQGAEYEWCTAGNHGGYAGADRSRCDDGTAINAQAVAQGAEATWCGAHLGWSAVNTPPADSTAGEQPYFAKNDCEGPNIKAGEKVGAPNHCGILDILTLLIKILSGLVGVVVVAMIVMGGIQYSASGGEAAAVAAAKKRITSAILALVLYFFAFAILQYLIPGGVIQ